MTRIVKVWNPLMLRRLVGVGLRLVRRSLGSTDRAGGAAGLGNLGPVPGCQP